jgi:hypothetical protein
MASKKRGRRSNAKKCVETSPLVVDDIGEAPAPKKMKGSVDDILQSPVKKQSKDAQAVHTEGLRYQSTKGVG